MNHGIKQRELGITDKFTKSKGYQATLDFLFGPKGGFDLPPGYLPNGKKEGKAAGGFVKAGQAYRVGEFGPETFIAGNSGFIQKSSASGSGNTFIFNGVIDGESARRSIERLLQNSAKRTSPINLVGSSL